MTIFLNLFKLLQSKNQSYSNSSSIVFKEVNQSKKYDVNNNQTVSSWVYNFNSSSGYGLPLVIFSIEAPKY